jgi:predicted HTH transcriptional regulator
MGREKSRENQSDFVKDMTHSEQRIAGALKLQPMTSAQLQHCLMMPRATVNHSIARMHDEGIIRPDGFSQEVGKPVAILWKLGHHGYTPGTREKRADRP